MYNGRTTIQITTNKVIPKKRIATIYLECYSDSVEHIFYCFDCRNPIMKYVGEVVSVIPGNTPINVNEFPIKVQCSNKNCKKEYSFRNSVLLNY